MIEVVSCGGGEIQTRQSTFPCSTFKQRKVQFTEMDISQTHSRWQRGGKESQKYRQGLGERKRVKERGKEREREQEVGSEKKR